MPTLNPWMLLGALASAIALLFGGYAWGSSAKNTWWLSRINADKAAAVQQALSIERANQEKANAAIRQQAADQAAINNRLRSDLAGLRHRPERAPGLSAISVTGCSGATGAELSRSDASFLVGEAARADEVRAGLIACYAVIDGVRND
ncbi:MAG: hypothetical protein ACR2IJ_09175 [Fluviibacter sp.]